MTSATFAVLVPLLLLLTFRVIRFRRTKRVSLGTDNQPELIQRVRAHGNFVEYTPLFLIGLALCELNEVGFFRITVLATLFCIGRYTNAVAISLDIVKLRFPGMFLTLLTIVTLTIQLALKLFSF